MRGLSTDHKSVTCISTSGQLADQKQGKWTLGRENSWGFSPPSLLLRKPEAPHSYPNPACSPAAPADGFFAFWGKRIDESGGLLGIHFSHLLCCKACVVTDVGVDWMRASDNSKAGSSATAGEGDWWDRWERELGISKKLSQHSSRGNLNFLTHFLI